MLGLAEILTACGIKAPPNPDTTKDAFYATLTPEQQARVTAALETATTLPPSATATEAPTATEKSTATATKIIKSRPLPDLARKKGVDISIFLTTWDTTQVLPGREKAADIGLEIGTKLQLGAGEIRSGTIFKNFDWALVLENWDEIQASFKKGEIYEPIQKKMGLVVVDRVNALIDFAVTNGLDPEVTIGNILGSAGDKFLDTGLLSTKFSTDDYWKILEFITKSKTVLLININKDREKAGLEGRITDLTAVAEAIGVNGTPQENSGMYALLAGKNPDKVADGKETVSENIVTNAVANVFTWAREMDPEKTIALALAEDYLWCMSLENDKGVFTEGWQNFYRMLKAWKQAKIPIDKVREEGTGWAYSVPKFSYVIQHMKQVIDLGFGIGDCEYTCSTGDVFPGWKKRPKVNPNVDSLEAQAEYFTTMLQAHYEVAEGKGFGTFGPMNMEGNSYPDDPNAHIFDKDGNPNPAYYA